MSHHNSRGKKFYCHCCFLVSLLCWFHSSASFTMVFEREQQGSTTARCSGCNKFMSFVTKESMIMGCGCLGPVQKKQKSKGWEESVKKKRAFVLEHGGQGTGAQLTGYDSQGDVVILNEVENNQQEFDFGPFDVGFGVMDEGMELEEEALSPPCCANCQRDALCLIDNPQELDELSQQIYTVELSLVEVPRTSRKKKFFLVELDAAETMLPTNSIMLCKSCAIYLTTVGAAFTMLRKKDKSILKLVWPVIVWHWLKEHKTDAWRLIPKGWQRWWRSAMERVHPHLVAQLNMKPVFQDLTLRIRHRKALIKGMTIKGLKETTDSMYTDVQCPWGCHDFSHCMCGLNFDTFIGTYLEKMTTFTVHKDPQKEWNKYSSHSPGYFSGRDIFLLRNPRMEIKPSIAFDEENVPYILVCEDHRHGDKGRYIHPPFHPEGNLASPYGHQLAPVKCNPRTIAAAKRNKYSATHSTVRVQGGFQGLDSCVLTSAREFAGDSKLQDFHESLVIAGRKDIANSVSCWAAGGSTQVSSLLAKQLIAQSERIVPDVEVYREHLKSATYITLQDSMELHEAVKLGASPVLQVQSTVNGVPKTILFSPYWPKVPVFVHRYTLYGAVMDRYPALPREVSRSRGQKEYNLVCDRDLRLVWFMYILHLAVPFVWKDTFDHCLNAASWEGWLLSVLAQDSMGLKPWGSVFRTKSTTGWGRLRVLLEVMELRKVVIASEAGGEDHLPLNEGVNDANLHNVIQLNEVEQVAGVPALRVEVPQNMEWADKTYHPEQLNQLFEHHSRITVLEYEGNTDFNQLEEHARVLVLYKRDNGTNSVTELPERVTDLRDKVWELRVIGNCSPSTKVDNKSAWNGRLFCRHGGEHSAWQVYSDTSWYASDAINLDENLKLQWKLAVFVQSSTTSFNEMRQFMMSYTGGQNKVHCAFHKLQLISSPRKCQLECCYMGSVEQAFCRKTAIYQCSSSACTAAICRGHYNGIQDSFEIAPYSFLPTAEIGLEFPLVGGEEGGALAEEFNEEHGSVTTSEDSEWDDLNMLPTYNIDLPLDAMDDCLSEASSISEDNGGFHAIGDFLGHEEETEDNEHDDPQSMPTTDAGRQAFVVEVEDQVFQIPGLVVLNGFGSLLARTKNKFQLSRNQQYFLQKLVSVDYGVSSPLIYPEGMLFPEYFWRLVEKSGSLVGALPSGLLTSQFLNQQHRFANVKSQLKARLKNSELPFASDTGYLCFACDIDLNQSLRGQDSRLVLNRGFTNVDYSITNPNSPEPCYSDSIDHRPTVHKLAAALARKEATYFLTLTCNEKLHFGMRNLKAWIDSDEVLEAYGLDLHSCTELQKKHMKDEITKAAMFPMLRQWREVSKLYCSYIFHSHEEPLGRVDKYWYRYEFEDSKGAQPHIHMILWNHPEHQQKILDRIRGSLKDLIRIEEIPELIRKGLVKNEEEVMEVLELAKAFLSHVCNPRCLRMNANGKFSCRVPHNALLNTSGEHLFRDLEAQYSDDCNKILARLELMKKDSVYHSYTLNAENPDSKVLKKVKHVPPAYIAEGKVSQTSTEIFCATLSNCNLQLMDSISGAKYLAKYVTKPDQPNQIKMSSHPIDPNAIRARPEELLNIKITGNAIHQVAKDQAKRDYYHPTGRALSVMEMVSNFLGYHTVFTNIEFIHIPTVPLEERCTVQHNKAKSTRDQSHALRFQHQDLDATQLSLSFLARNHEVQRAPGLKRWEKLSPSDVFLVKDLKYNPYRVDPVTVWSKRPPALKFIQNPVLYFRWFWVGKKAVSIKDSFDNQLEKLKKLLTQEIVPWIDMEECYVYVYRAAVSEVLTHIQSLPPEAFYDPEMLPQRRTDLTKAKIFMRDKMNALQIAVTYDVYGVHGVRGNESGDRRRSDLKRYLLGHQELSQLPHPHNHLPVPWCSNINPTQQGRWLYHILLSMGCSSNEYTLQTHPSIKAAFIAAKLLSADPDMQASSMDKLLLKYITTQAAMFPGGSKIFDRMVVAANSTLHGVLQDQLPIEGVPPCLYTKLREKVDTEIATHLMQVAQTAVEVACHRLTESGIQVPDVEELLGASCPLELHKYIVSS
jgi:hypothetical protein